jgi:hypothetical protein
MIYVIFILVSYLAASSATIAGFGSSTLLIPVALLFMDIKTTIFIVAFFHLFNNIFKIKMFWSKIDFNTFLLFGIPSIILAFIGAALISVIPVEIIKSILAVFLIIYSIYTLINPKFALKKSKASAVVGGGFSGLLAGLIGMGGAIRSAFLIAFNLPKEVYIATSAMIAVVIDVTRIPTYFFTKVVQGSWHYIFLFFLFVSAYLGVKTGKILLKRINQKTFRKIVSIVLFLVGVKMLIL